MLRCPSCWDLPHTRHTPLSAPPLPSSPPAAGATFVCSSTVHGTGGAALPALPASASPAPLPPLFSLTTVVADQQQGAGGVAGAEEPVAHEGQGGVGSGGMEVSWEL